jgi:hypothetical protein
MHRFLLMLLALLSILAGGRPAVASDGYPDKFVKRVFMGDQKPTRMHGAYSWDGTYNGNALRAGSIISQKTYNALDGRTAPGFVPDKVKVPTGKKVQNFYVKPAGKYAEIYLAVNNSEGTWTVKADEPRWIALYGEDWFSPGTCFNLFRGWCPPAAPKTCLVPLYLQLLKKLIGDGPLADWVFVLEKGRSENGPWSFVAELVTDEHGYARFDNLEPNMVYRLREKPNQREHFKIQSPSSGEYIFRTPSQRVVNGESTKECDKIEKCFVNEYCPPAPEQPEIEGFQPEPVFEYRRRQYAEQGYRRQQLGERIEERTVASFAVFSFSTSCRSCGKRKACDHRKPPKRERPPNDTPIDGNKGPRQPPHPAGGGTRPGKPRIGDPVGPHMTNPNR